MKVLKTGILLLILLLTLTVMSVGQGTTTTKATKTVVNSEPAKKMLLGNRGLRLQWLDFNSKELGKVAITDKDGLLYVEGRQEVKGDYLEIKGTIAEINEKQFLFDGVIITRVNYINKGEPCKREGRFTFRISGARQFWRMKEQQNPCDEAADYVDIMFR